MRVNAKKLVKLKYPDAYCEKMVSGRIIGTPITEFYIWENKKPFKKKIGYAVTQKEAWMDAFENFEEED